MIQAESILPEKRGNYWTEELKQITMGIKYYRLILRRLNGVNIDDQILCDTKQQANIKSTVTS